MICFVTKGTLINNINAQVSYKELKAVEPALHISHGVLNTDTLYGQNYLRRAMVECLV